MTTIIQSTMYNLSSNAGLFAVFDLQAAPMKDATRGA